jgi:RND family efflux transporter MFP subunit
MKRLAAIITVLLAGCGDPSQQQTQAAKPALTVTTTTPQAIDWPQTLAASGNVAAWQEAVIGAEISNYRIADVRVNVGDTVRRGQVLARIAPDQVDSEYAEVKASVAEAEAMLAEARSNLERARQLREKGFYSPQQITQTQTAAESALARLQAAQARLQTAAIRRSNAAVLAPDDGVISARAATVGTLTQSGQELFRLIRGGRLEWRAEVSAADLGRVRPGLAVRLLAPGGETVEGSVRAVAPSVNPQTHTALVYVDLPPSASRQIAAGMFARGELLLGTQAALALPVSAVLLREGFAYIFRVEGGKVAMAKVTTGRREGEMVEVAGIAPETRVVASGAGFLADGDTVRVLDQAGAAAAKP